MSILKPSYATGYAKNASQSAHPNLWDGLVGAWMPSLGVTGETLRDVSGNGNHGTLTNMDAATDWVATSKGLALDFDGVSGRVESKDESGRLSFTDGSQDSAFSLIAKCYFRTINNGGAICGKYRSYSPFTGEYNLSLRGDGSGKVLLQTLDGAVNIRCRRDTVAGISANQWYSISATYDGTGTDESIKIFINGNSATSAGFGNDGSYVAMQRHSDPSEFTIGRDLYVNSSFNTTANGHITDVYAYNRALSPAEIKQLYVDSLSPFRLKKRTVVRVPATVPTATKVGSFKKPVTIAKPSYQAGYARNASESENPKLWDGLVGAWMPSLGVTGETLRDVSGNGNHGTLTNMDAASDWVTTSKGLALDFDGVNDSVSAGDSDKFSFGDSTNDKPFTVESLCRFSNLSGTFDGIIAKDNGSVREWSLLRASSTFRFFLKNQGGGSQQSVDVQLFGIQTNRWYSVAASYDGRGGSSAYQGMKIYVDGVERSVAASAIQTYTAMANTAAPLTIGSYAANYFAGNIASSKLYNRALSASEIKQLYVDPLAPFRRKQRVSVAVPAGITFKPYWAKQSTQVSGLLK